MPCPVAPCRPCHEVRPCHPRIFRDFSEDEFDCEDYGVTAVLLNIYDLSEEWLASNDLFHEVLELGGAFHAGVEVYGREWSFGTFGVASNHPRSHDVHVYRQSLVIGYTKYSPDEVNNILEDEMAPRWAGKSYDLLSRNCCTFSRAFCRRLTGNGIPGWVDRLPRLLNNVTKPLKNAADAAFKEVGQSVRSAAPVSHSFPMRRDCSIESSDSNFSTLNLARNESFIAIPHDPSFHAPASPAVGGNRSPAFMLQLQSAY